jgi:metal-sulfur cluster biosynthetic enzyme
VSPQVVALSAGPPAVEVRGDGADRVLAVIRQVADPCSIATGRPVDLVGMGLVQYVEMADGRAAVGLRLTSPACFQIGLMASAIQECLRGQLGIEADVHVDPTDVWSPDYIRDRPPVGDSTTRA